MEMPQSTEESADNKPQSTFTKIRGMLGSRRRLVAPFIVAMVLLSAVSLFLLISDNLITAVVDEIPFPYSNTMPGVILPMSEDWLDPETDLPESQDVFKVSGAGNTVFLRCFAATTYDGEFWLKDTSVRMQSYNGQDLSYGISGYSSSSTDVISVTPLIEIAPGYIPTALYPIQVDSQESLMIDPDTYTFFLRNTSDESYSFTTTHYDFDYDTLQNAEVLDEEKYLLLPDSITDRTRQLALDITADYNNPADKAKAIETYLLTNYEYTTDFDLAPEGHEATDWFLFEGEKGIHTHFSSAFVVLARCAGITTRLVSGYFILPQDAEQTVNTLQVAVLAEVGYKDLGWIIHNGSLSPDMSVETYTYIDEPINNGEPVQKGQPFIVSGTVETKDGFTVVGMPVSVWLWQGDEEDKPGFVNGYPTKSAYYVESGFVTSEGYSIECNVPDYITAGEWNIIVNSLGFEPFYLPSDSDPGITISTPAKLTLLVPSTAAVGELTAFVGRLIDSASDEENPLPIPGVQVQIEIIDTDDPVTIINTLTATTLEDGTFFIPHAFSAEGDYGITVSFGGSGYYTAASDVTLNTHVSWDTGLTFDPDVPQEVKEGTTVDINGRLTTAIAGIVTDTGLSGRTISIYLHDLLADDTTLLGEVTTDASGYYSLDYIFADSGKYRLAAEYIGEQSHEETIYDGVTGEPIGEQTIWTGDVYYRSSNTVPHDITAYSAPTLTLWMDQDEWDEFDGSINNYIRLYASLINEFGEPVTDEAVDFSWYENEALKASAEFNTNDDLDKTVEGELVPLGYIYINLSTAVKGDHTVDAVFDATEIYPETDASIDFTVWRPTEITINDLSAFDEVTQGTTVHIEGILLDYWDDRKRQDCRKLGHLG